jgi:very-short-patch-repair endonuclease
MGPGPMGDTDGVIRALAARQHGVVERGQLLEAGVAPHAVAYRVAKGRLHVLYRGVYRVGPLAAPLEREMAGVLACGVTAVLSHHSAGAAWTLLSRGPGAVPVEVSGQGGYRAPDGWLRLHRVVPFAADETTTFERIPITTPARTLVDLAGSLDVWELERAVARADRQKLVTIEALDALLARYPGRAGCRALRAVLGRNGGSLLTRSDAEARFVGLMREAVLPPPEANVAVEGFEVDFVWRAARLVVEVDGFEYHSSRSAFERDRRRDAVLAASGFRVIRVTWRQLTSEPKALVARVARALGDGA